MKHLLNLIMIVLALFITAGCQGANGDGVETADPSESGTVSVELKSPLTQEVTNAAIVEETVLLATPTITETILTVDFLEYVALVTIDEQIDDPIDGAIISYLAKKNDRDQNVVWRYSQGSLQEINHQFHYKALGNNKANWPPLLYIFSFEKIEFEKILAFVEIHYSGGITDYSRGGRSERLIFRYWKDQWSFLMRENVIAWD